IYPAMSDQGLAAGGVLQHLLERDGLETWLKQRYRLDHLYFGYDYSSDIDPVIAGGGGRLVSSDPVKDAAALINAGKVVAIYTKGMEYGPRALGARTIMAAPVKAEINQ